MIVALYSPTQKSGKSTVANILRTKYEFAEVKFASPLRDMAWNVIQYYVNPMDKDRYLEGDLKESIIPEIGVSVRTIYRTLGTEWGRNIINQNLWRDILFKRINPYLVSFDMVISDLRFGSEYYGLREKYGFGVIFIKITRPGLELDRSHKSEGLLDEFEFDYEIINDGSLIDLERKVNLIMEQIGFESNE